MKTAQDIIGEIKQLLDKQNGLEKECPSCGEVQPLFIDQIGFQCDHCGYHEEGTNPRELFKDSKKVKEMFERFKNWKWDLRS